MQQKGDRQMKTLLTFMTTWCTYVDGMSIPIVLMYLYVCEGRRRAVQRYK